MKRLFFIFVLAMCYESKAQLFVSPQKVGLTIFTSQSDVITTSTDGSENDLYSYTLPGLTFNLDGESVEQFEQVAFIPAITATRRLRKYFGNTIIYDTGIITLSLGANFTLTTNIIRESSSTVRCTVAVTSTSASVVSYSTYTRITGLDLADTQILKTVGIAAGIGAASGDIINQASRVELHLAP
jgi:hypothetical protein